MVKEIAGGKYNHLMNVKIAIGAKTIIHKERPEFFTAAVKELTTYDILAVAAAYLSALTRFEEEQEETQKKAEAEKNTAKDNGWFPGDCCD